jgi:pentatricopeptide repeat protein
MPEKYFQDTIMMTSALKMFLKIGDMDKAKELFTSMKSKDLVSYGAMIKGYYLNKSPLEALNLFWEMKKDGIKFDVIIYVLIVQACSQIGMIEYCRSIVGEIPEDYLKNQILQNVLIDMWAS